MIMIAILSLTACATTQVGNKFDAEKAASFKIGKTTYNEVIQALGESSNVTEGADGSKTISYSYGDSHVKPTSYIPVVGAFIGGTDSETHVAVFSFDKKSILRTKSIANQGGESKSNSLTQAFGK